MELVHDDSSAAQYERCTEAFQRELDRGQSLEDIVKGCEWGARDAEEEGDLQRVDDFLLIGKWAQHRIDEKSADVEKGHQISNRMAGERRRRRDHIEANQDISAAIKEQGIKIGPTYDELKRRRDWNARAKGRDGL